MGGGRCCLWVTTLKACWSPAGRKHVLAPFQGFRSWPTHTKRACLAKGGFRPGYCPMCDVPLAANPFLASAIHWSSLPTDVSSVTPQGRWPPLVGGGCCLWVTTLKACWSLAGRKHVLAPSQGLRRWPTHTKARLPGKRRVPPWVLSHVRCSACCLPNLRTYGRVSGGLARG